MILFNIAYLKAAYPTGQPAHSKENFVTNLKSSTKMALRASRPRCSTHQNLPPIDPVEDELTRDPSSVKGSFSGSISPAPSRNPTPGPKLVSPLILAPVPAPTSPSSNDLFKQFIKAYLESNQEPRQPLAERERSLKDKLLEVYYDKSHIDCYHFCQQGEDYFETAGATGTNRTPFAASFLCGNISVRWT